MSNQHVFQLKRWTQLLIPMMTATYLDGEPAVSKIESSTISHEQIKMFFFTKVCQTPTFPQLSCNGLRVRPCPWATVWKQTGEAKVGENHLKTMFASETTTKIKKVPAKVIPVDLWFAMLMAKLFWLELLAMDQLDGHVLMMDFQTFMQEFPFSSLGLKKIW